MVILFDGKRFHSDDDARWSDIRCDQQLGDLGYQVVHLAWRDFYDVIALASKIHAAMDRARNQRSAVRGFCRYPGTTDLVRFAS